ncbi:MAG: phosphomannomutase/phosphoglucomutase [Phycisphaerales bacterium]
MLGRVFKAYDIRATYPNPLNEATAWKIGYGGGRFLLEEAAAAGETDPMMKHVVVGRDMRKSSPKLCESLTEGLRTYGAHVIDVGEVDTPFIYFAINYLDCAGGFQTTASHNPANYNGFKISGRAAVPIGQDTGLGEISKYAAMADQIRTKGVAEMTGRIEQRDLWDGYQRHVLRFLNLGDRSFKVVVDASNGMAGTMMRKVFKGEKNLKLTELNFDNTTGEFVHDPNPLVAANLVELREKVRRTKADLGVCFDGDADRCIFVDENAEIIGCDHLTALLARHFLEKNPGASIVYDLRSSKAVEEEIKAAGGVPVQSRVGHVFMKQVLREHKAVFGGELSGHFYFRDNFNADSGAIVFATVLTMLAGEKKKLGELIKPIKRYAQSGEINFENEEKESALEELAEHFADRGEITRLDGVTVDCFKREGWWMNVRQSNTEPLLRLNLEARDRATSERMVEQVAPMLGKRVEH